MKLKLRLLAPLIGVMSFSGAAFAYSDCVSGTVYTPAGGSAACYIPTGVTSLNILAIGGGGGGGGTNSIHGGAGGSGAQVSATVNVTPGDLVGILIGRAGGGAMGTNGGGGGASSTVQNLSGLPQFPLAVAGGGGGGGCASFPHIGGDGGGGNGLNGASPSQGSGGGNGGGAGIGGAPGPNASIGGNSSNTFGAGGPGGIGGGTSFGQAGTVQDASTGHGGNGGNYCGGGGGGGFGGGGGGGGGVTNGSGGGGGGSFAIGGGAIGLAGNGGAAQSSGGDGSVVLTFTVPVVPVATPIPNLPVQPVVGIGQQPAVLDMNAGEGPAMTNCLMDTVRKLLGVDAAYLGQNANGVAKISQGGRIISFYPLLADTNASQNPSINLNGSNVQSVGTTCGTFSVVPAVGDLTEFGALLNGMGLTAQIDAQGVIMVNAGASRYVARPDYMVAPGVPGAPSLKQGADGVFHFSDSTGNQQVLHPAFADTSGLAAQDVQALNLVGSTSLQLDGSAVLAGFGGKTYSLTPDLTLTAAPAANAASLWWQDAPNHFIFRSSTVVLGQGFTAMPQ